MPLYEYRCELCGEAFSERRPIDNRDLGIICPRCDGTRVMRLVSAFAAFGRGDGEAPRGLGSSPCSGCSSTSCSSCGVSHS